MGLREISDAAGVLALLLFCLAATLRASRLLRPNPDDPGAPTNRKDCNSQQRVVLPVVVTDRRGQFVSGLRQDDFLVFEDGKRQVISSFGGEDGPMTIGLVVDSSDSMRAKRSRVTAAISGFAEASNPDNEMFVVNFNDRRSLPLAAHPSFSNNALRLADAVHNPPAKGDTALYDAVYLAAQHLQSGTREQKSLLIISDGGDNDSRIDFHQVLDAVERSDLLIYTLGILGPGETTGAFTLLTRLSKLTGGTAYIADSSTEMPSIGRQIARDLRQFYTLAYVSANHSYDVRFRSVRVVARVPGQGNLLVRTRTGYMGARGPALTP